MDKSLRNFWGAMHPDVDRLFIGLWYVPIGIVLHFTVVLSSSSTAYNGIADASYLPFYSFFFKAVVAPNGVWFAVIVALFELILGLLIFSRGRVVKIGLLLSAIFQIVLAPMGDWGIINVLLALISAMLIPYDYEKTILEIFAQRRRLEYNT